MIVMGVVDEQNFDVGEFEPKRFDIGGDKRC